MQKVEELEILCESEEAGVHIISDLSQRQIFILGHCEYDRDTLAKEYQRDIQRGLNPKKPRHYFPYGDVNAVPRFNWCCSANLLYANWLNHCVYQKTPYDLGKLEPINI